MLKRVEVFIAVCFYYSGLVQLARWWKKRFHRSLVILCYHQASGGNLRRHLLYLRKHYRILHLEAALQELYTPYRERLPRRERRTLLVLTFDDGYRDNYTYAFPLARQLQVPITTFLIPGYIENRGRFWWLEGEHLVRCTRLSEASVEGRTYHLDQSTERAALVQAIDAHACNAASVAAREDFLATVRAALAEPSAAMNEEEATLSLTWAEVREMDKSKWISFGAHTMHHPVLAELTYPTEVQYEVSECRIALERKLDHPVRAFAYPVGQPEHIGEYGLPAVREAGYDWAVTTIHGFNTPQTNPYLLRRFVVDVDQHWLSVAAKASGVWDLFTYLCRSPVTLLQKCLNLHR
jgi:peptidoglycan/xylan/chitin deacetylase (PgdA/CDA1 family)